MMFWVGRHLTYWKWAENRARNKTTHRCLTSSNKKLVGTSATLVVTGRPPDQDQMRSLVLKADSHVTSYFDWLGSGQTRLTSISEQREKTQRLPLSFVA